MFNKPEPSVGFQLRVERFTGYGRTESDRSVRRKAHLLVGTGYEKGLEGGSLFTRIRRMRKRISKYCV